MATDTGFHGKITEAIMDGLEWVKDGLIDCSKILLCVSGSDPGPSQRREAKSRLIDSLEQLCRYALENTTDYTLALALENSDREADRMALLGPNAETVAVVQEVRRRFSNCGILLDQGHFPLMKEDPADALEIALIRFNFQRTMSVFMRLYTRIFQDGVIRVGP